MLFNYAVMMYTYYLRPKFIYYHHCVCLGFSLWYHWLVTFVPLVTMVLHVPFLPFSPISLPMVPLVIKLVQMVKMLPTNGINGEPEHMQHLKSKYKSTVSQENLFLVSDTIEAVQLQKCKVTFYLQDNFLLFGCLFFNIKILSISDIYSLSLKTFCSIL